jgi:hypothetical protein
MIPYNKCACQAADTVGFIDDTITNVRTGDWDYARILSEQLPDRLRRLDAQCITTAERYNEPLQQAIRRRDFHALTEARAQLILGLCGLEFPEEGWEVTQRVLQAAVKRAEEQERSNVGFR